MQDATPLTPPYRMSGPLFSNENNIQSIKTNCISENKIAHVYNKNIIYPEQNMNNPYFKGITHRLLNIFHNYGIVPLCTKPC